MKTKLSLTFTAKEYSDLFARAMLSYDTTEQFVSDYETCIGHAADGYEYYFTNEEQRTRFMLRWT